MRGIITNQTSEKLSLQEIYSLILICWQKTKYYLKTEYSVCQQCPPVQLLADGKSAMHTLTLTAGYQRFLMSQQLCVYILQSLLQHRFSYRESPGGSGCGGSHWQPPSTAVCSPAGSSAYCPTVPFTGPCRGHISTGFCLAVCQAGPGSA